jgi:hypothetical protein
MEQTLAGVDREHNCGTIYQFGEAYGDEMALQVDLNISHCVMSNDLNGEHTKQNAG